MTSPIVLSVQCDPSLNAIWRVWALAYRTTWDRPTVLWMTPEQYPLMENLLTQEGQTRTLWEWVGRLGISPTILKAPPFAWGIGDSDHVVAWGNLGLPE